MDKNNVDESKKESSIETCCAPDIGGIRCKNNIEGDCKFHCSKHKVNAHKLYIKYKKICAIAKTLHPEEVDRCDSFQDKMKFLNRCFFVFKRAYDARKEHQK